MKKLTKTVIAISFTKNFPKIINLNFVENSKKSQNYNKISYSALKNHIEKNLVKTTLK